MDKDQIIKAWKDPEYRDRLGASNLPEHPAGRVSLSDSELEGVFGGQEDVLLAGTERLGSLGCCTFGPKICGFTVAVWTYGCCPETPAEQNIF